PPADPPRPAPPNPPLGRSPRPPADPPRPAPPNPPLGRSPRPPADPPRPAPPNPPLARSPPPPAHPPPPPPPHPPPGPPPQRPAAKPRCPCGGRCRSLHRAQRSHRRVDQRRQPCQTERATRSVPDGVDPRCRATEDVPSAGQTSVRLRRAHDRRPGLADRQM